MKYLFISIMGMLLIINGCNKEISNPVIPPVDDRTIFEIDFLNYSDNNYFIDEIYADTSFGLNLFNIYYGSITPIILTKYYVKDIEVYISSGPGLGTSQFIEAYAYIDLQARTYSDMYPDSIRFNNDPMVTPGQQELTRFRRLDEGSDYIFNRGTGHITFLFPLKNMDVIAAAYRIENDDPGEEDDLFYGEFISELVNNSKTRAVLKLIKPRNLIQQYKDAWKLKLKNIYKIEPFVGKITDLSLDIYLRRPDGSEINAINNIRLLELFGFDKFTEDGAFGGDGKFDNRAGINFEPRTSEIIFPLLQPFGINIPSILNDYKYQGIYDTIKYSLSVPDNRFIIKGKYKAE